VLVTPLGEMLPDFDQLWLPPELMIKHAEQGEVGTAVDVRVTRLVEHDVVLLQVDRAVEDGAADLQWARCVTGT
jgi:hypothetical protein